MARRYPTLDRLLALLMSLVVAATGTATPDDDSGDDFDATDDGASTSETTAPATQPGETGRMHAAMIRIPPDSDSCVDGLWVIGPPRAVGAVAVAHDEPWTALVSVVTDAGDEIQLAELLGRALHQCRRTGDLRVIVSADESPESLRRLVEPHGFMFGRAWRDHGRTVAEFYVNLYARLTDDPEVESAKSPGVHEL